MKKIASLALASMLTVSSIAMVYANPVTDIKDHWAKETITQLTDQNIISGYPDGSFRPDNSVSVAEFIKIATSSIDEDIEGGEGSNWYVPYVDKALDMGLVKDGEFSKYNREITRGEMARIISRALEKEPQNVNKLKRQITDFNKIPSEIKDHVAKVYAAGIITGYEDGSFKYDRTATRAEASAMLLRLLNEDERKVPEVEEIVEEKVEEKPYNELSDFESVPLEEVKMLKNVEFSLDRKGKPENVENVYFLKESDLPIRLGNIVIEDIDFEYDPYDWECLLVSGYVLDDIMTTGTLRNGLIYRNETYQYKGFTVFFKEYYDYFVEKYPNLKGLDNNTDLRVADEGEKFTYIASFAQKDRFDYEDYNFNDLTHIAIHNYYEGKNVIVFENFLK